MLAQVGAGLGMLPAPMPLRKGTAQTNYDATATPAPFCPAWQVPRGFGDAFGKLARFSRTMAAAEAGAVAAQVAAAPAAPAAAVLAPG